MDEYEVVPIDGDMPDEDDVIPTEDEQDEAVIDDEEYDPTVPTEPGQPEESDEGPAPEPEYIIEPDDEDVMPTEDEAEEITVDDEEWGGGEEPEPDINDNEAEIAMVGAVREGDVFPALKLGSSLMGIAPAGWGDRMQSDVDISSQAATEAKAVAQATGQHFWEDSNGAHVTEITKDEWKAEEAEETPFADVSDSKPYHNLLMNSLGILLRTALKNLVSITRSAIAFFDGNGNDAANVVASFGKDGFQVGATGESHLVGDYHSLQLVDRNGNTFYHISDIRNENGLIVDKYIADGLQTSFQGSVHNWANTEHHVRLDDVEITTGFTWTNGADYGPVVSFDTPPTNGSIVTIEYYPYPLEYAKAYTVGLRKSDSGCGMMSYAEGVNCEASGYISHAEGFITAAVGRFSHAEGHGSIAGGTYSHAEGQGCKATGNYCHAEGASTTANGLACHAEGQRTTASQRFSHAEGEESTASAYWSHAQNLNTIAASQAQTALGKYNVEDANDQYAAIIGNGTSDNARSNALTVGWDGSVDAAGAITSHGIVFTKTNAIDVDGSNPSAVQYTKWFQCSDKDDDRVAIFGGARETDGRTRGFFYAYNKKADGTLVNNHMFFYVDKNGNCTYGLSDPAAFCKALHVGDRVTDEQSTNLSIANAAWKNVCSLSLAAGTWVIEANVQFASNATGRRYIALSETSNAASAGVQRQTCMSGDAVNGASTFLHTGATKAYTEATTLYLVAYQNSGAALNVQGLITAVRIR